MNQDKNTFYVTTPIYYVNGAPHIGHVYSTLIADVIARYNRMLGTDTFFLTGTDEHATKVVDTAAEQGLTTQQWADQNADAFKATFERLGMSNDDFIRTSEDRHKIKVTEYVKQLLDSGDVYLGEYEGWYDAGQEEYVPENKAKEHDYKSPINGKPLVRKTEQNYFFKLSKYQDDLLKLLESSEEVNGCRFDVQPNARKNEIVARIKDGLHDIPMTRTGMTDWGITIPGDEEHTIYVWVDALFNYLSAVDTDDRIKYWPADVHVMAKDILWFHAAIWPALMLALGKPLPKVVYAHSFFISEGQKMSKSLGNFIDMEKIDHYIETFGLDALRWFLATKGPIGATDSDFAEARFIEAYNSDLANTFGNCASRISNMIGKYFDGKCPEHGPHVPISEEYNDIAEKSLAAYKEAMEAFQLEKAADAALEIVRAIDNYIERTAPFKLAKDPEKMPEVGTILYNCAEALRVASVLLWPLIPNKVEVFWDRIGFGDYAKDLAGNGMGKLDQWAMWGHLQPGTDIQKGDPLFMRYQVKK
ncbi:methionine--tRNA ligase [Planctomycetota bacterium]|nr:methionine--tRNA ligase [Planctomycetota bacterium]